MEQWSERYTCFAFDTPGFGLSDPLPKARMNVVDLADAMAETMRALGLSDCPIVGSHTGAAVALELAARHPDLVSGVVLEGLPVFLEGEMTEWFTDEYFATLQPSPYGEHLTWAWTRVRDCDLYFPWIRRIPENFYSNGRGTAEKLHQDVADFFACADHYKPAYQSAVFYKAAFETLQSVRQPALITASSADLMFPHLDRLGELQPEHRLLKLGPEPQALYDAVEHALRRFPAGGVAPDDIATLPANGRVVREYVELAEGQMLVRVAGQGDDTPILIIPDAPGSSIQVENLLGVFGEFTRAVAVDLPGTGESAPLGGQPNADNFADAVARICAAMQLPKVRLYAVGFGSAVALALAQRHPDIVERIALNGVALLDAEDRASLRASYAPPIEIQANGAHWYDCWLMLRDSLTQWPWYDSQRAAIRANPETRDARSLHGWTVDVMKQWQTYDQVILAALAQDSAALLARIPHCVRLYRDPTHRLSGYIQRATEIDPSAARVSVTETIDNVIEWLLT
jgi:pimeloyl-ACP methyl ester carboxylesterase